MADNKKKKKADGKRIALGQKHEVAYLKKIAKEVIKLSTDDIDKCGERTNTQFCNGKIATSSIRRIAKALLKYINKK